MVEAKCWFAMQQYRGTANGVGAVAIPTLSFNIVYQLYHLYHHYFYEDVGLRQIVDYYYVILNLELGVWNCRLCDEELKNCGIGNSKLAKASRSVEVCRSRDVCSA